MLSTLITILGILITILFVVGTHEWAHFMAARLVGIKVLKFSIGFGKSLFRFHDKKGTEYVFALIPLGGYVKMLDENEGSVPEKDKKYAYNHQPFWKKCFVILAGPMMNLFCAFVLYWLVFVIGFTTVKPIVGSVKPDSIAAEAGMQPQQQITSIDNVTVDSWTGIIFRLVGHAGDKDILNVGTQSLKNQSSQDYKLNLTTWKFDALKPDLLDSLGIVPYEPDVPLVIGVVGPDSPAAHAGLKLKDKILELNGIPVKDWMDLITKLYKMPGEQIQLKVLRDKKAITIPITVGTKRNMIFEKYGYLGVAPIVNIPKEILQTVKYSPLSALSRAWTQVKDLTYFNLLIFWKMISGKLSLQSLGGPITIFESAGTALNSGITVFLTFLAFLSLSVGIINLFPIPGLDGGHILVHGIEVITGKPLSERAMVLIFRLGFLFILFIFVQAFINDVLRLY